MSLEALIADCHRRGYRVGDLSELRGEAGVWRARLWDRADKETDFSTGRSAEIALKNALAEITGAPGSEKARTTKKPAAVKPVAPKMTSPLPIDLDDLLSL